jgi:hypothetical protein
LFLLLLAILIFFILSYLYILAILLFYERLFSGYHYLINNSF